MNGLNLFKSIYTQILKCCKNTELAMAYACDLILQLQDANYNLGRIANIEMYEEDDVLIIDVNYFTDYLENYCGDDD